MFKRKNYCQNWKTILNYKLLTFIDEKPFEMGKVPNRQNTRIYQYRSKKNTIPNILTQKHSTKIHTFCCINWKGKSDVKVYVDYTPKRRGNGLKRNYLNMDNESTIDSLSNYLIPFLDETEMKNEFILMDGARCHISEETVTWMNENHINFIPFGGIPTRSINGYPPFKKNRYLCDHRIKFFKVLVFAKF